MVIIIPVDDPTMPEVPWTWERLKAAIDSEVEKYCLKNPAGSDYRTIRSERCSSGEQGQEKLWRDYGI